VADAQPVDPTADARSLRSRLSGALTVGGYRAGAMMAKLTPSLVADGFAAPIGFTASWSNRERRAVIERHLLRVNPHWSPSRLRGAVQQAFDSYARYWIESVRLPALPASTVAAGINLDGYEEHVLGGLDAGRGVILALPHLGGWEWAGRWLGDQGHRTTVVVERVEPPELFDWFQRLRSKLGMTVVPLGPGAGPAILRALGNNEIVCLLSDRDIAGGGVWVDFIGERTTLPAGPATLALRTGAPLVPVGVYFTPRINGHFGLVRPPIPVARRANLRTDVARVTQYLADELEYLIRRAPEQWHMFQPNWPSDPGYWDLPGRRPEPADPVTRG
jgi:KDO2-lipid IV(A) lauroyltransferase